MEKISTRVNQKSGTLPPRIADGTKEKNLARRRFQRGQLLLHRPTQTWSVRYYEDVIVDGERKRRRKQDFLGTVEDLPTKPLALRAMQEKLLSVNSLTCRPTTTATFREIAKRWMQECKTRKRKPIKPSVLVNWQSILDNHLLPVLGSMPIAEVGNGAGKQMVSVLLEKGLSPQTIKNIMLVVKLAKASVVDGEGNELFPTKWKHDFMDMPIVDEHKQPKPSFTVEQVTQIVKAATGRLQMAAILLGATGLRLGELLGLEVRHFDGESVRIEQEWWFNRVLEPKTPNAKRVVDLHPDVATLLKQYIGDRKAGYIFQTRNGTPLNQSNLLASDLHPLLEQLGIPMCGFHAFRRFRATYLRNYTTCPDGIRKFWLGWSGEDMGDRYDRVRDDLEFRRDVAKSVGVGFELPKTLTPKPALPNRTKRPQAGNATDVVPPVAGESGVIGRQLEMAPKGKGA